MKNLCDYMIIQRDSDGFGRACISGAFESEEEITIAVHVVRESDNLTILPWSECKRSKNKWEAELRIPEGGLYRVEVRAARGSFDPHNNSLDWGALIACARHVGVGDIFVLAGQSNMSAYGRDTAFDPPQLGVHLLDNSGNWVLASHPLNTVVNPIYPNNDENSGTSPGLAFGKMMSAQLGVPVGLISAAKGGSSLSSWNPADKDCFLYKALEEKVNEAGKIAGIVWYQGCNETCERREALTYLKKFEQTVSLWREKFGNVPVVTCQINRHAWKKTGSDRNWGLVREAQRQAAEKIENVYVVPTLDLFTTDGIHNSSSSCVVVGERLANVLLYGWYKKSGFLAPTVRKAEKTGAKTVKLYIDNAMTLKTMDDVAEGMNIEDENGMMNCTKVSVCDGGLLVTGERKIGKNAVFHAYWKRIEPAFFVRDIYGLPLLACYGVKIED